MFTTPMSLTLFSVFMMLVGVILAILWALVFWRINFKDKEAIKDPWTITSMPVLLFFTAISLFPTRFTEWIDDTEFGLSRTKEYNTGVHLNLSEIVHQIPRTGTTDLINAKGIGSIKIQWMVVDPKKLVPIYGDFTALSQSGTSGSLMFNNWIQNKLVNLVPKGRELLVTMESTSDSSPKKAFMSDLDLLMSEYGIECIVYVTQEYVLSSPKKLL